MATFLDLRTYVTNDGWTEEPNHARGRRRIGDHRRYFRDLRDGIRLRTKVPHDERAEIGADLFHRILRDQLRISEDQFWGVVHGRVSAEAEQTADVEPIPGWLVTRLIFTVGLPEADVAGMTVEGARAAWLEYQSRSQDGDA